METFVVVIVILAMIAVGVFLIHRLNSQHSERIAAFHYARSGTPVAGPGPPPPTPRRTRGRMVVATAVADDSTPGAAPLRFPPGTRGRGQSAGLPPAASVGGREAGEKT